MKNELFLYGSVGESFWGEESFTALEVATALAALRGPLTVRLNSGGGIATEGQAIYTLLSEYSGNVTVIIDGVAASAASLIAMAGNEIVMPEGSLMVIHDPATPITDGRGTAADHSAIASMLETISAEYAKVYARRSGKSVDEAREIMRAETVYGGADAALHGFATRTDTAKAAAFDYRIYANAPRALREASNRFGIARSKEAVLAMIAGRSCRMEQNMNVKVDVVADDDQSQPAEKSLDKTGRAILSATAKAGLPASFANDLINRNVPKDEALTMISAEWKKQGDVDAPMFGRKAEVGMSHDSPQAVAARMADGLAARVGSRIGVKYEPKAGAEFAEMSVPDMIAAYGRLTGGGSSIGGAQMAGYHTTSDFALTAGAGAMTNVVKAGFAAQPPALLTVANKKSALDYRSGYGVGLSGSGAMKVLGESAEIQAVTVDETGENKAVPDDLAAMFFLSNKSLVNDGTAMQMLAEISQKMLIGAQQTARNVLIAPLLANSGAGQTMRDTNPLFFAARGNLAASGAALSVASLSVARTAMARQVDSQGNALALAPKFLVVPPELQTVAEQLVATLQANIATSVNPFAGKLEVITEAGLTSATAWYLVADPLADEGLCYAYLDGQEAPSVESKDAWNRLGMDFRITWALGAAFHGWRGWYKNAGA
ncbi:MAG: hypothetical protein CFE33_01605 [Pseudorhodobacter sp. PARRP1]|nr:MAG: hypothetical protein CFE33_01605 [Pseudorhodobacter sp. PARRP1]